MEDDTFGTGELADRPGYTGRHGQGGGPSAEPDVLLDVPQLRVDEIILDVEDLSAHVSVEANVLNLLRLSVGADVQLGGVHLEIRGVEAQALLKVRLDKIAEIINRVLTTIDRNPEIVDQIVPPLGAVTSELERTAGRSVDEVSGAVGSTASDLDRSVADAMTGEPGVSDGMAGEPGVSDAMAGEPGVSDAMAGEPGVSDAMAGEQVVAEAPQHAAEPAGSNEGTPRGFLRRLKQERNTEELSP
ncbi:MAG TPA: hypothetical protein VKB85_01955 [Propionibacteriaceae bacterium]|nr:hypothetical protein [Propionibacteriaceae bacterium]